MLSCNSAHSFPFSPATDQASISCSPVWRYPCHRCSFRKRQRTVWKGGRFRPFLNHHPGVGVGRLSLTPCSMGASGVRGRPVISQPPSQRRASEFSSAKQVKILHTLVRPISSESPSREQNQGQRHLSQHPGAGRCMYRSWGFSALAPGPPQKESPSRGASSTRPCG